MENRNNASEISFMGEILQPREEPVVNAKDDFDLALEEMQTLYEEWDIEELNIIIVKDIDGEAEQDLIKLLNDKIEEYMQVSWEEELQNLPVSDISALYLKEISAIEILTPAKERELTTKYYETKDVKIRDKILRHNLRLVAAMVAKKYAYSKIDFLDLVQEGNLGLLKGIEKFDPRRGFRLSTYVVYWINQSIRRTIAKTSRTIKVPGHVTALFQKIKRFQEQYLARYNKNATMEEIAMELNTPVAKIKKAIEAHQETLSLDYEPRGDGFTLSETLQSSDEHSAEKTLEREALNQDLNDALANLNEREQEILLRIAQKESYSKIGKSFGITKERVRQIKDKALEKLRSNAASMERLQVYLK